MNKEKKDSNVLIEFEKKVYKKKECPNILAYFGKVFEESLKNCEPEELNLYMDHKAYDLVKKEFWNGK